MGYISKILEHKTIFITSRKSYFQAALNSPQNKEFSGSNFIFAQMMPLINITTILAQQGIETKKKKIMKLFSRR